MAFTALDSAYVLDDKSVAELIEMESAGSAPISSQGFVSRSATSERLSQLTAILSNARSA